MSPELAGLRVALMAPCFWPEVRRGGERIVRELADGLLARDVEPRLITSHPGPPRHSVEDGLPITRLWRPPDARLRRRAYEDHLTHAPFSYLDLRRGDDQLAHAFFPSDALAAAAWSRRAGRPFVLTHLGVPARPYLVARRGRLETLRRALAGAAAVTVLSSTAADALWRSLGVRAEVIHPAVDLDAFSPGDGRSPEPAVLCAAPVESPMKRVDVLLAAWPHVRRARPAARLMLLRPRDPRLADDLAARGVELLDPVERPRDLAPTYRRAWVSVLPSRTDSFGLVLAEALACGTPGVGSAEGAIPEVLDRPEIGRTFADDEPRAVARAVLEGLALAEDPATPAACRTRAEDFAPERSLDQYLRVYAEALEGGPKRHSTPRRATGATSARRPASGPTSAPPSDPEIAVVVATRRRPVRLRWLLDALEEQTLAPERFEVVVAHDGGDPETARLLAEAHGGVRAVTVAPGDALPGPLRNAGWRAARAPLVAFTDDDCRPPPDWLERGLAVARAHPGAIVQGATRPDPDEAPLLAAAPHARSQEIDPPTPWVEGCNVIYPRELLEAVGGFDEDPAVPTGEDTDLALRARDVGADLVAAPEALTHHAVHTGWLGWRVASSWRWQHMALLVRRHPRLRRELTLGVFWKRRHAWLALAAAGGALAARGHRTGATLALPWAIAASRQRGANPRGIVRSISELPGELVADAAEMAALARGSIRHRSPLL